jgi:hypothetical protein
MLIKFEACLDPTPLGQICLYATGIQIKQLKFVKMHVLDIRYKLNVRFRQSYSFYCN